MPNVNETIAGLTITARTEGVDQAKKQVEGLTQSTQQLGIVSETTSKGARSLEESWKRATLRFDEAARAQANMTRETKLAEAAVQSGVATQQQAADHLKLVAQRYGEVATASKQMVAGMSAAGDVGAVASNKMIAGMSSGGEQAAKGIGLARHELVNLSRQAQDVGVSLASGQSPLTVLMQQGSQIADVFIASGKSVGSFFSQAIGWATGFLASTAGIVTGIAAFGVAAVYAMSQFARASTTVKEALEEQNRLLKEGKALIDARTSAEARSQLQSKEQTQFETVQNRIDLEIKLRKAMEETAKVAERRFTTPTGGGMPEMGIAPSGVAPLKDPGYDKLTAAFEALRASQQAGLPGLKQYNAELAKIGEAHPELALIVQDMIKLNEQGMELEQAALRAKAMEDALKGIATNAQMAAVGLGSVAQFQLNNRMANEAKEATERQAQAVLKMAQAYPGMSVEVAKTLSALQGQLGVAQAVGVSAQIEAQHRARINELLLQGKTLQEAIAVADKERAIALARIEAQHRVTMVSLQGQLAVAQERTGLGQINAQYEADINNKLMQGLSLSQAIAEATLQRESALARVNAEADQQLKTLQQQGELINANTDREKAGIAARHTYENLLEKGVDAGKARAVADQQHSNALREISKQEEKAAEQLENQIAKIKTAAEAWDAYTEGILSWSRANDIAGDIMLKNTAALERYSNAVVTWGETVEQALTKMSAGDPFKEGGYTSLTSQSTITLLAAQAQYGAGNFNLRQLPGGGILAVSNKAEDVVGSQEWYDKMFGATKDLTEATKANTEATTAQTDVLSPFYSSDPRRTHLGFRAFAGGGVMTKHGELPLKQYQGGGIATSPQVAVYGEGSMPEAYVPVPAGRIPVELKMPANSNQRPVNVTINVMGNADAGTVAALKATAFQQAQTMRRAMA